MEEISFLNIVANALIIRKEYGLKERITIEDAALYGKYIIDRLNILGKKYKLKRDSYELYRLENDYSGFFEVVDESHIIALKGDYEVSELKDAFRSYFHPAIIQLFYSKEALNILGISEQMKPKVRKKKIIYSGCVRVD